MNFSALVETAQINCLLFTVYLFLMKKLSGKIPAIVHVDGIW